MPFSCKKKHVQIKASGSKSNSNSKTKWQTLRNGNERMNERTNEWMWEEIGIQLDLLMETKNGNSQEIWINWTKCVFECHFWKTAQAAMYGAYDGAGSGSSINNNHREPFTKTLKLECARKKLHVCNNVIFNTIQYDSEAHTHTHPVCLTSQIYKRQPQQQQNIFHSCKPV